MNIKAALFEVIKSELEEENRRIKSSLLDHLSNILVDETLFAEENGDTQARYYIERTVSRIRRVIDMEI